MSEDVLALAGALLSLAGALVFLVAAIGLLRLPDFYCRAHSPTKAATLGILLCTLGSALAQGGGPDLWLEKVLVVLFVMLTTPVSNQLLVRGAAARRVAQSPIARGRPIAEPVETMSDPGAESGEPGR